MNRRTISKLMLGGLLGAVGVTVSCSGSSVCDGPGGLCVSPGSGGSDAEAGEDGEAPEAVAGGSAALGGAAGAAGAAGGGAGTGGDLVVVPPETAGAAGCDPEVGSSGGAPVGPLPCSPLAPQNGDTCSTADGSPSSCSYPDETCVCEAGSWVCTEVEPPTCAIRVASAMLIDDFEDDDSQAFALFPEDEAVFWYSYNDGTGLQPVFEGPVSPGAASAHAAHTLGTGFTIWGAGLGLTLNTLLCPVDLSATQGLRFKAKGEGNVRLNILTRSSASPANGGDCQLATGCDFSPFFPLQLTEDWQEFSVPWASMQPGSTAFDPREAIGIQFAGTDDAFPAAAPIDFELWVDDVELYDDQGAGGSGGEGGASP